MKYERQQHSPLFIALQERKRKIENAATPHTLQGTLGIIFSVAKEELRPIFTMHRCHGRWHRTGRSVYTSPFHSENFNKFVAISFLFWLTELNRCSGKAPVAALCCLFVTIQTRLQLGAALHKLLKMYQCCWERNSLSCSAGDNDEKTPKRSHVKVGMQLKESLQLCYAMFRWSSDLWVRIKRGWKWLFSSFVVACQAPETANDRWCLINKG